MTAGPFPDEPLVPTGIAGLDEILAGGLPANSMYLVEGDPGSGKTTLALQYLLEATRHGERSVYVTLSETEQELRGVARSHGWSLDGIHVVQLGPSEESLEPDAQLTMFHPSEVELSETTKRVLADVEAIQPSRVVFDSLSEMRLLAQSPLRYRRQILALKQFFVGRSCTVLLLDDRTSEDRDLQLQSLAHGVIRMEQLAPEYGSERRRLRVVKLRGVEFRGGYHDFVIKRGGLQVFPRLVAAEHRTSFPSEQIRSGVEALDALVGGGLERGTSALLIGPAGAGKSSLATQYAVAMAERGEPSILFIFDESAETLVERSRGLGLELAPHLESGLIHVRQIDPAELAPGEFVSFVREAVEAEAGGARMIVIDSLNGYLNAMPGERFLVTQLHELLTYLGQQGVLTLLVLGQQGLVGPAIETPVDISYLADTVILLRYFEAEGSVRQAISVVKKRRGRHERSIRELQLTEQGIRIGEPLRQFHGVLSGEPVYDGAAGPLMRGER